MITQEEHQSYTGFLKEQADTLQCLEIGEDDIVWHYTNGESFLQIIQTGTLYATQVSCLNDSTEVAYGAALLAAAFKNIRAQGTITTDESQILDIFANTLKPGYVPGPSQAFKPASSWWFVICFSKEKDDLSQWRAYSGGENGYAIGFRARGLFGEGGTVARVNYDKLHHKEVAARSLRLRFGSFEKALSASGA
jgi:hypothetical protein